MGLNQLAGSEKECGHLGSGDGLVGAETGGATAAGDVGLADAVDVVL